MQDASSGTTVLVVDDEPLARSVVRRVLGTDFEFTEAESADEARRLLLSGPPFDLVLCDIHMPGGDVWGFAEQAAAASPDTSMVFVTGEDDIEVAERAVELCARFAISRSQTGHTSMRS